MAMKWGLILRAGGPSAPAINSVKLVAEGDSITAGALVDDPATMAYPAVAVADLPTTPEITLTNISTSGTLALQMSDDFETRAAGEYDVSKDLNIYTIMAGANDRNFEYSDKEIYLALRSALVKAKTAGFDRRLIGTLISNNEDTPPYRQWSGDIGINGMIRDYWNSDLDADGLFDFGADSRFDTYEDANDTTIYNEDKTHLTQTGYAALASIYKPVVAAAIAGPGTRVELPATWFPIDTSHNLVLSNGNRTLAWPPEGGFSNASARGGPGKVSGKWYFEIALDVKNWCAAGIMNIEFTKDIDQDWVDPTQSPNALAYHAENGNISRDNTVLGNIGLAGNGDVIAIAIDLDARKVWIRRNAGQWNGTTADPASNTGGIDISALGTGTIYPVGHNYTEGQLTSRFAVGETTGVIPSGFTVIGG